MIKLNGLVCKDIQILQINRDPTLDDYTVTIHYQYSNPAQTCDYPLAQARNLFPTLIGWHIVITSGSKEVDPKLCWAID
jgi:hypothetical protein